ncbi:hypothetical protein MTO96_041291, partial [Rhipicephalus appendiculatus]
MVTKNTIRKRHGVAPKTLVADPESSERASNTEARRSSPELASAKLLHRSADRESERNEPERKPRRGSAEEASTCPRRTPEANPQAILF